jgi:putative copper resistance protein D
MTGLEVAVRFVHLASVLVLAGSFSFGLLVRRPAFKNMGRQTSLDCASFYRALFSIARLSLLLAIGTAIFGLFIKSAEATGLSLAESINPGTILNVLTGTRFGIVWLVRMALFCLLAVVMLADSRHRLKNNSPGLLLAELVLSVALLTMMAAAGHASAAEGATLFIQLTTDGLHLLAAGVWLGGLIPVAIFFSWAKAAPEPAIFAIAQEVTAQFSRLGFASVALLVVTGLVNAWYLVGGIPPLLGTTYGYLLLAKLAILSPLMGLASRNRWRLKPRLTRRAADNEIEKIPSLLAQLQRGVTVEVILGAFILVIVGVMGTTPPARHVQPVWPLSFRLDWSNAAASADIQLLTNAGAALSIVGIVLLASAVLIRRNRRWIATAGGIIFFMGLLVAANALSIDAYPTTYVRPSVAYNAISVANGKLLYGESCTVCHGIAGYGDGPAARDLKPKPADLTARHTASHTVGDLYWWLSYGIKETAMPGFKESFSEDERWDLINFLRALSNGERARSLAPVLDTEAWLVAPDFAYGTSQGETKTLKDHRGDKIILLVLVSFPESKDRLERLDKMAARLTGAGVEIILVAHGTDSYRSTIDGKSFQLTFVTEGNDEIFKTYSLFGQSFETEGGSPEALLPKHTEFLIDKRGYIRARWIAKEGGGWREIENLLQEIETLKNEKSQAPAPDDHVH